MTMPHKLVRYLRPGVPALMLTTEADGYPSSAYTWVVCLSSKRLRFVVDYGSSAMANLQRTGQAAIQIIGPGDVSYLVKGKSRQIKAHIKASALVSMALFEMNVMGAKDQSWTGVSTTALTYEWPPERCEAMREMEKSVYAEMSEFVEIAK